jgi:hypothetical protein
MNKQNREIHLGKITILYARPVSRRVFPELFAHKVVSVQPLYQPMGLAYAMRYTYDNNGK